MLTVLADRVTPNKQSDGPGLRCDEDGPDHRTGGGRSHAGRLTPLRLRDAPPSPPLRVSINAPPNDGAGAGSPFHPGITPCFSRFALTIPMNPNSFRGGFSAAAVTARWWGA